MVSGRRYSIGSGWMDDGWIGGSLLGLGFGRSGFLGVSPLSFFPPRIRFWDSFFGGILFGEMADNGWTVCISRCFGGVLRVLGERINWKIGNLCGMEGFGWRRRESGKKLSVMSGYEWLGNGKMGKREVRQSEWD